MANLFKIAGITGGLTAAVAGNAIAEGLAESEVNEPIVNPTNYEEPRGMTEEFYDNPEKPILEFPYSNETFQVRRDGRVFMKNSDYEFVLDDKGRWYFDKDKSRTATPGDEAMKPEFGYNITKMLRNALIKAKEDLALYALKNEGLTERNKSLLEKIALAEDNLAKSEGNVQEYIAQLGRLRNELDEYSNWTASLDEEQENRREEYPDVTSAPKEELSEPPINEEILKGVIERKNGKTVQKFPQTLEKKSITPYSDILFGANTNLKDRFGIQTGYRINFDDFWGMDIGLFLSNLPDRETLNITTPMSLKGIYSNIRKTERGMDVGPWLGVKIGPFIVRGGAFYQNNWETSIVQGMQYDEPLGEPIKSDPVQINKWFGLAELALKIPFNENLAIEPSIRVQGRNGEAEISAVTNLTARMEGKPKRESKK